MDDLKKYEKLFPGNREPKVVVSDAFVSVIPGDADLGIIDAPVETGPPRINLAKRPTVDFYSKKVDCVLLCVGGNAIEVMLATPLIRAMSIISENIDVAVYSTDGYGMRVLESWPIIKNLVDIERNSPEIGNYAKVIVTSSFKKYVDCNFVGDHIVQRTDEINFRSTSELAANMEMAYSTTYAGGIPRPHCFCMGKKHPVKEGTIAIGPGVPPDSFVFEGTGWTNYEQLITVLNRPVALVGLPGERTHRFNPVKQTNITDYFGKLSLGNMASIIAQCKMYIGNHNVGLYIAAAFGVPAYGIFGACEGVRFANNPWFTTIMKKVACQFDCYYTKAYKNCHDFSCMNNLTVGEIFNAIKI